MKKSIFCLLIFTQQAIAHNYLDNPNFDKKAKEWEIQSYSEGILKKHKKEMCTYTEDIRDEVIFDNYISVPVEIDALVSYMCDVPQDIPLYFYLESSFENGSFLDATIALYEGQDLLIKKNVRLKNQNIWSSISSDYPVYKKKGDSKLRLQISFPFSEPGLKFNLNYAQVGTDPKSLGGRGRRSIGEVERCSWLLSHSSSCTPLSQEEKEEIEEKLREEMRKRVRTMTPSFRW